MRLRRHGILIVVGHHIIKFFNFNANFGILRSACKHGKIHCVNNAVVCLRHAFIARVQHAEADPAGQGCVQMVKRVFPIYRAAAGHGIQLQRLRIIPNRDCKRMCKIVFAFNAKIDVCRFALRRRCRVRIKKHRLRVYPECLGTRRRRPNKAAQNRCGKNDCSSKKSCKSAFCFLYFSVCHLILNPPRDFALILSFFCMICNTLQQKPRPRGCPQGRGQEEIPLFC